MPICPFCQAKLGDAEFQSGRCPKCKRRLSPDDAQDRGDSPVGPESDGSSAQPPKKVGGKTTDDRRFAETIQPGAAPGVPGKPGRKTADDRRIAETLRGSPSGAARATQDDRGTADDRRITQTLEAGGLEPEVAQRITQLWSGTLDPDTAPRTSIKSDVQSIMSESELVIQSQVLREKTQKGSEKADYELTSRLGEGGMGIVYAARQAAIDRTVAVKMLKPRAAGDEIEREKFLSEAVVTGDLEHPNIVPIYNLGKTESGHLFYSMKRVQGTPWDTVIAEKTFAENIETLMKVADAVALAHSRGVIHRDLKPENVMLGDFGEVLLMDWGLAVSLGVASRGIGMGGTPAYMAPEMAAGPIERIGFASDIYLLGAILYEIITDQPPHLGKNVVQCLLAAAKNEIQPTEKSGEQRWPPGRKIVTPASPNSRTPFASINPTRKASPWRSAPKKTCKRPLKAMTTRRTRGRASDFRRPWNFGTATRAPKRASRRQAWPTPPARWKKAITTWARLCWMPTIPSMPDSSKTSAPHSASARRDNNV